MLTNRTRRILVILLGLLLYLFACVGMTKLAGPSSQAPIRTLRVTINKDQRQELFDRLQEFANKHVFSYSLTDYGGQGKYFLVDIRGTNIKILAHESSRDLTMFDISFYALSPGDPLPEKQIVDDLVVDLKSFIGKIPNIGITEE
jgi:hypothetical protein